MSRVTHPASKKRRESEPTWDVAYLFPEQGDWSEEEYLALDSNRLVELSDGNLEVLPVPTESHHLILAYLYGLLNEFVHAKDLGTVIFAGIRVRLWPGKIREPDIIFMMKENDHRRGEDFWQGADLVMEVVSGDPKDRERDLKKKRREYARAGIPEYWIVDPAEEQITVLRLSGKRYVTHGEFRRGSVATSPLLPGFAVDVDGAWSQKRRTGPNGRKRRN